jgi:hypothetical protein
LTLVSKKVHYLREICVPRRNNVKETYGSRGDDCPRRRDGLEDRCCIEEQQRLSNHGKWWSTPTAKSMEEEWWSTSAAFSLEEEWRGASASVALEVNHPDLSVS